VRNDDEGELVKPFVILALLAVNTAAATRATSSHAATTRGVKEFADKKYEAAAKSFAEAQEIRPSAEIAFNRGTAEIAAGKASQGSATLSAALNDPRLRADALYNRGNSALTAKAYEHAVRDYVDVLKLRPNDANAKRNLEIALIKKQEQDKQSSGGGGQSQTPQPNQPQKPKQPSAGAPQQQQPEQGSGPDAEALLRSVQQQEQEERRRMKAAGRDRQRVGW
jgi:Ca-activated chloride channel family protein